MYARRNSRPTATATAVSASSPTATRCRLRLAAQALQLPLARARPLGLGVLQLELPWVQLGLCTRDSILGAVSQSGGVPTGAVIQRGSNANGEFVRFADGTQICAGVSSTALVCSVATGVGFSRVTLLCSIFLLRFLLRHLFHRFRRLERAQQLVHGFR